MRKERLIYLDSAATSLQKPKNVSCAVMYAMKNAASTGRSDHISARKAAEAVFECRCAAAELFGVPEPENVVFTHNATHALNIAINALVDVGDTVLVSGYEHNSVTRPLFARKANVIFARSELFDSEGIYNSFCENIDKAKVVVCTHVSNVFGFVLPIERIAALCKEKGKPLIIDASQSAGTLPLDFSSLGADFAAMPGHKGLHGPQGTGLLLCSDSTGRPLLFGGSGSESLLTSMPEYLPDRFEAGTLNVPGVAGLLEGIRFVQRTGTERILQHERGLLRLMKNRLANAKGIRIFASDDPELQTGVLSVAAEGKDCTDCADFLARHGIAVRSGLHCAPEAHRTVGTLERGTVRLSFSPFNDESEVLRAAAVLSSFCGS